MKSDFLFNTIQNTFQDYYINFDDKTTYGIITINKSEHEIFRIYSYEPTVEDSNWYLSFSDFTGTIKIPNEDFIYFINDVREISDIMVNVHRENDKALNRINILIDDDKRKSYFRDKKLDKLL